MITPWDPRQRQLVPIESFRGMRDVISPGARDRRDTLMLATNIMPMDPVEGGPAVMRPGAKIMSPTTQPSGVWQLAVNYRIPGVGTKLVIIKGGAVYQWNGTAWVEYISASALLGASITLNTTGPVYSAQLGGKIVFSDGTNTPWMYDGATSTLTKLTNAPVFYGPITVYYAKIFGVKNTERDTMVWSEENDATIGYEAGGYNNAWQLGQTGGGDLTCLLGTNQGLFYFRAGEIGWIRGAVSDDFQNDGTRDGVTETVGTTSPRSVTMMDNTIYWVDAGARPWRYPIGGDPEPLYPQMARQFDHTSLRQYIDQSGATYQYGDGKTFSLASSDIALIQAAAMPLQRFIVFGYVTEDDTGALSRMVVFHHDTGSLQCYWDFGAADLIAGVDWLTDHEESLFIGQEASYARFVSYNANTTVDQSWSVPTGTINVAVTGSFVSHELSYDTRIEWSFERLTINAYARNPVVGLSQVYMGIRLQTSDEQVTTQLQAELQTVDVDLASAVPNALQRKLDFGFRTMGRWARVLGDIHGASQAIVLTDMLLECWAMTAVPARNTST